MSRRPTLVGDATLPEVTLASLNLGSRNNGLLQYGYAYSTLTRHLHDDSPPNLPPCPIGLCSYGYSAQLCDSPSTNGIEFLSANIFAPGDAGIPATDAESGGNWDIL